MEKQIIKLPFGKINGSYIGVKDGFSTLYENALIHREFDPQLGNFVEKYKLPENDKISLLEDKVEYIIDHTNRFYFNWKFENGEDFIKIDFVLKEKNKSILENLILEKYNEYIKNNVFDDYLVDVSEIDEYDLENINTNVRRNEIFLEELILLSQRIKDIEPSIRTHGYPRYVNIGYIYMVIRSIIDYFYEEFETICFKIKDYDYVENIRNRVKENK